jgi:ABC-2 type transport system permease protein
MPLWTYEWRLLLRSRAAVAGLILLAMLSSAGVLSGLHFIAAQRANIAQVPELQDEDMAAVRDDVSRSEDAGSAAYYSFHPTWDAPSALAFAAIGMRDVSPYILRVRALGLEAQIHDSETYNPELALAGRFDYSFVLVFLAPLFVIALLYDLRSGEREAGRARMLAALPAPGRGVYLRRVIVRALALSLCLLLPFVAGALASHVPAAALLSVVAISLGYLAFWIVLSVLVGRLMWRPAAHATTLAACWVVLALVAPALAHVAINAAVPVDQGAEIAREQREAVNHAWDIPRQDTMRKFYAANPEWADSAPLGTAFHYKWYFAFHENGDQAVAPQVHAYRQGLLRRERLAHRAAWLLPPVAVQAAMTALAGTDLQAQLAYQDRVRAYHARLRRFYYGYLFGERRFRRADFEQAPRFSPAVQTAPPPA